jgi:acetyltransferase-like isoleucine patch superfamily enzyme
LLLDALNIHPTALISPKAHIADNVRIGPFSVVHANVVLAENTIIESYCELGVATPLSDGSPLSIGENSRVRSHSVFYEGSSIGNGLITGHRVTVREGTHAGIDLQLGTSSEVQGDCQIGDYVRFQSNVFVAKNSKIGNFVWLLPNVVLTNDPTPPSNDLLGCVIEDYASIAAMAVILPGVTIGEHSFVAAHACVSNDVPARRVVAGVPARVVGETKAIRRRDGSGMPAYPWTAHFHRGYPKNIVAMWQASFEEIKRGQK